MSTKANGATSERLALSVAELANALNVSQRHIWKMLSSGRLGPKPFRLGRSVRWNRAEVVAWLDAGCPPRERWEQMKAAQK